MVELLSTAFQSGPFGAAISGVDQKTGKPAPMALGNYFLAIDVEALVDINVFKQNAGNLLRFIRGSAKDPRGACSGIVCVCGCVVLLCCCVVVLLCSGCEVRRSFMFVYALPFLSNEYF